MTDNERLAKWQEWEEYHSDINKHVPDYLNDDSAAISLLTTLTAKNLYPSIDFNADKRWTVIIDDYYGNPLVIKQGESSYVGKEDTPLTQVIVSAVLELIEKGGYND